MELKKNIARMMAGIVTFAAVWGANAFADGMSLGPGPRTLRLSCEMRMAMTQKPENLHLAKIEDAMARLELLLASFADMPSYYSMPHGFKDNFPTLILEKIGELRWALRTLAPSHPGLKPALNLLANLSEQVAGPHSQALVEALDPETDEGMRFVQSGFVNLNNWLFNSGWLSTQGRGSQMTLLTTVLQDSGLKDEGQPFRDWHIGLLKKLTNNMRGQVIHRGTSRAGEDLLEPSDIPGLYVIKGIVEY